jgi:DNA mismatch endonuclease (patch repair protein)
MRAISSKHTNPELLLRKALFASGYRFRVHYGKEKIDIAFPRKKIAVFVDGCFWHMCPKHGHVPKSNKRYWLPKLKKNAIRAKEKGKRLKASGWKAIHIWEHEIPKIENAIRKISRHLESK